MVDGRWLETLVRARLPDAELIRATREDTHVPLVGAWNPVELGAMWTIPTMTPAFSPTGFEQLTAIACLHVNLAEHARLRGGPRRVGWRRCAR